jgi:hypothetical protein
MTLKESIWHPWMWKSLCSCHVILVAFISVATQLAAKQPGDCPSHNEEPTYYGNRYEGCCEVWDRGHSALPIGHVVVWASTSRGWCQHCLCCLYCWNILSDYLYQHYKTDILRSTAATHLSWPCTRPSASSSRSTAGAAVGVAAVWASDLSVV